jgi:hypothetical protein
MGKSQRTPQKQSTRQSAQVKSAQVKKNKQDLVAASVTTSPLKEQKKKTKTKKKKKKKKKKEEDVATIDDERVTLQLGGAGGGGNDDMVGKTTPPTTPTKKRRSLISSADQLKQGGASPARRGRVPNSPHGKTPTGLQPINVVRISDWAWSSVKAPARALALAFNDEQQTVQNVMLSSWERTQPIADQIVSSFPVVMSKFKLVPVNKYNKIPVYELDANTEVSPYEGKVPEGMDMTSSILTLEAAKEVEDNTVVVVMGHVSELILFDSAISGRPIGKLEIYDKMHRTMITFFNTRALENIAVGQYIIALCTKRSYNDSLQLSASKCAKMHHMFNSRMEMFDERRGDCLTIDLIDILPTLSPPPRSLQNSIDNRKMEDEFFTGINLTCVHTCGNFCQLQCHNCPGSELKFDMDVEAYKCITCNEIIEDDDQVIICAPFALFRLEDGTEFEAQLKEGQQSTFYKCTLQELADGKVPDMSAYVDVLMKATVRVKESLIEVKNLVRI